MLCHQPADVWGNSNKPRWHLLHRDPLRESKECPGFVLLKINLSNTQPPVSTDTSVSVNLEKRMYKLVSYVYQGRGLPSADSNGLSDPFLNIHMGGNKVTTDVKPMTQSSVVPNAGDECGAAC